MADVGLDPEKYLLRCRRRQGVQQTLQQSERGLRLAAIQLVAKLINLGVEVLVEFRGTTDGISNGRVGNPVGRRRGFELL